jgi:NAD(P)-dependent dehydrogenase (short-subunit alcohol dehydrogenase family)
MVKVFALGASRNIGYYAALDLLRKGNTFIFFVRNPTPLENDPEVQPYLQSKHAKLIRGDALNEADVTSAWNEAMADGVPIDYVLFSVGTFLQTKPYRHSQYLLPTGGTPSFSLTKGFVVTPPNLCTHSLLNTLIAIAQAKARPRVIAVTSQGITKEGHRNLPLPLRLLYATMEVPHIDKHGMEQLAAYCDGRTWTDTDHTGTLLPDTWKQTLGEDEGWLKTIVVVRPALLTDGVEKGKYRVGESLKSAYTISRRDVAHFIAGRLMEDWDEFQGKAAVVGY